MDGKQKERSNGEKEEGAQSAREKYIIHSDERWPITDQQRNDRIWCIFIFTMAANDMQKMEGLHSADGWWMINHANKSLQQ